MRLFFKLLGGLVCFVIVSCVNDQNVTISDSAYPENVLAPLKALSIENVSVISMVEGFAQVLENQTVLVVNDKIVSLGPSLEFQSVNAIVVEGKGKFLLPGLIDTHVHIWDEAELSAYLAYGVTTVRNTSGMPFHLQFRDEIAAGDLEGPRLITTGPILNGQGPNTQVNHQIVNNADEARAAVRWQYNQGYRHLKVYSNLSRESYEEILREAKRLGMDIMGHTPEGVRDHGIPFEKPFHISFEEVLSHKLVSIEHMESIIWHALSDDLNEKKVRVLAKRIAKSGVAIDPTLIAHHNLVKVAETQGEYLQRAGTEMLNPFIGAFEKESYDFWASQPRDARKNFDEFYLRALKIFREESVLLVTGTDAGIFTNIPGESLVRELALFVHAGLTQYEALEAATVNSARILGLENQVGQVKVGFTADLVLVDENPLENIDTLLSPYGVVVNGEWKNTSEIARLKRDAAKTSYERTERRVLDGLELQGSPIN